MARFSALETLHRWTCSRHRLIGQGCLVELDRFVCPDMFEDVIQILLLLVILPQLPLCVLVLHLAQDEALNLVFLPVGLACDALPRAFIAASAKLAALCLSSYSFVLAPVKLLELS